MDPYPATWDVERNPGGPKANNSIASKVYLADLMKTGSFPRILICL